MVTVIKVLYVMDSINKGYGQQCSSNQRNKVTHSSLQLNIITDLRQVVPHGAAWEAVIQPNKYRS